MERPYMPLGDNQQASKSDMASAIQELIDELVITDDELSKVKEILKYNNISYE